MAGQVDGEFRSVGITETSRNVVCLMVNVFEGVHCLDFDRNPCWSFVKLYDKAENGKSPKVGIAQPCTSSGEIRLAFKDFNTESKLLTLNRFPEFGHHLFSQLFLRSTFGSTLSLSLSLNDLFNLLLMKLAISSLWTSCRETHLKVVHGRALNHRHKISYT